jgi:hypothetical protein
MLAELVHPPHERREASQDAPLSDDATSGALHFTLSLLCPDRTPDNPPKGGRLSGRFFGLVVRGCPDKLSGLEGAHEIIWTPRQHVQV